MSAPEETPEPSEPSAALEASTAASAAEDASAAASAPADASTAASPPADASPAEPAGWGARLRALGPLRLLGELAFALLALCATVPVWLVERPPIQDLPQHLAAIRVLVDYAEPATRFSEFFTIELWRTQYLGWYALAWALAPLVGVKTANLLLTTAAVAGTPYAMRALLRALGRPEALALFTLPLAWNAHLFLGFMNFVAGIPLALLGIALAVRLREVPTRGRAIALGLVAIACFYMHVVPFGFLGLGAGLVGIGGSARATLQRWLPLVPAALVALAWGRISPAGQATMAAASLGEGAIEPTYTTAGDALRELPGWLLDVTPSDVDDRLLAAWGVLALLSAALGSRTHHGVHAPGLAMLPRVGLLASVAAAAYFVTPTSYGWIWPINARFPLLALYFAIPLLPMPRGVLGGLTQLGVVAVAALSFVHVGQSFVAFERDDVGELDEALEHIPEGSRTAALIFDRGSRASRFSPFLHSAAWVQLARGGAVMFTFADFDQSPIRFREDDRPPRVPPRWEWTPERVSPDRDLGWYEFVVTRGGPGRMAGARSFEAVFRGPRWSVWRRIDGEPEAP